MKQHLQIETHVSCDTGSNTTLQKYCCKIITHNLIKEKAGSKYKY